MMLLAATESFSWRKQDKEKSTAETKIEIADTNNSPSETKESPRHENPVTATSVAIEESVSPVDVTAPPVEQIKPTESVAPISVEESDDLTKAAERAWKASNPYGSLKKERELFAENKILQLPWNNLAIKFDPSLLQPGNMLGCGNKWPENPKKGDTFIRTDRIPTVLFKFNGRDWIEVSKKLTNEYAYNDAYIAYLINKIASGEYDADLLTPSEEEQIAARLGNTEPK
jgi:hypothetical protein